MGRGEPEPEPEEDVEVSYVEVPVWGQELTKDEVEELNEEFTELLTAMEIDASKYFNRPLDDYAAPVDVYEDLIHRLEEDGQEVDVTETMSTRLGDDHPLVVELRRREALADVKLLDNIIKEGLGQEQAAIVYKKVPDEFHTPLEYYKELQAGAEANGLDLVPVLEAKLGKMHPLPMALRGDGEAAKAGWTSMKKSLSFNPTTSFHEAPAKPEEPKSSGTAALAQGAPAETVEDSEPKKAPNVANVAPDALDIEPEATMPPTAAPVASKASPAVAADAPNAVGGAPGATRDWPAGTKDPTEDSQKPTRVPVEDIQDAPIAADGSPDAVKGTDDATSKLPPTATVSPDAAKGSPDGIMDLPVVAKGVADAANGASDVARDSPRVTEEAPVAAKDKPKRGFMSKLLSLVGVGEEPEADDEVVVSYVEQPVWGQSLMKDEVEELNDELSELLKGLGINPTMYINRPLDDFNSPADFYEDLTQRLEADEQEVDISETLATRLGDDHPLVVELRRREALADVRLLDGLIKEASGPEKAAIIYKKVPAEFHTPFEYYKELQAGARVNGIDLVPLIEAKLGKTHPLPMALRGDGFAAKARWQSMKKSLSFKPSASPTGDQAKPAQLESSDTVAAAPVKGRGIPLWPLPVEVKAAEKAASVGKGEPTAVTGAPEGSKDSPGATKDLPDTRKALPMAVTVLPEITKELSDVVKTGPADAEGVANMARDSTSVVNGIPAAAGDKPEGKTVSKGPSMTGDRQVLEPGDEVVISYVDQPVWGQALTKGEVEELNDELAELLTELDI